MGPLNYMDANLAIGFDPSYKRFGYSAAFKNREVGKCVYITCHREEASHDYNFSRCYFLADAKMLWLKNTLEKTVAMLWKSEYEKLSGIGTVLVQEVPPPIGQFSAGLYLLGGLARQQVKALTPRVQDIYPSQLRSLVPGEISLSGIRRKGNSTLLAKLILEENPGVRVIRDSNRWNNDEAEAFLLCVMGANNRGPFKFNLPPYLEKEKWSFEYYVAKEEENREKNEQRKEQRRRKRIKQKEREKDPF